MPSSITIRKIPDEVKQKLKEKAAKKGRSMEAEVRDLLAIHANSEASENAPIKLSELTKEEALKYFKERHKGKKNYFHQNWDNTDDFMSFMRG